MNNSGSGFLILALGDPHSLESRKRAKDRSSDPDKEFSLGRGHYFDFHCGRSQSGDFFAQTLRDSGVHCGSTAHDDVAIEIFSDIDIALED